LGLTAAIGVVAWLRGCKVVVVDSDVGDGGFSAGLMICGCGGDVLAAARDARTLGQWWWCPRVRVMYGGFGGATVHGDVAYTTWICSQFI